MKKELLVTTNDGQIIRKDLSDTAKTLPIGSPANSEHYAQLCMYIAVNGMPLDTSDKHINYLPPSQIKKVEVVFTPTLFKG